MADIKLLKDQATASFVRRIIRPERRFYQVAIVYGIAISLLTLAVPLSVQILINSVANTAIPQAVFIVSMLLFALLFLYSVLSIMQLYVLELFERRFFVRVTAEVVQAKLHTPNQVCAPFNRFFEVMHVQKSIPSLMVGGFSMFLQTIVGLVVVSFYHPFLLVFTIVLVLTCLLSWRLLHQGALSGSIAVSESKYAVADWLEHIEHETSAENISRDIARTDILAEKYLKARKHLFKYSLSQNILFFTIYVLASVCLLGLGGMLVIQGQLSLGQLVAAELILSVILLALSKLGYYLILYYELCAAALKLDDLLPSAEDIEQNQALAPVSKFWSEIRVTNALRLGARIIKIAIVLLVIALVFVPWVQTAKGTGSITALDPTGQPQDIHALVKGRIKKWYVRDGSQVQEGDPILEIIDNDPLFLERLEAEARAARKARDAAEAAAQTSIIDYQRKEELFAKGLASRRDVEQAKIDYQSWQAKEAEAMARLTATETRLSRQHSQLVRAPRDGLIVRTAAGDLATMVNEGDVLATFVPTDSRRAVELYISGMDMPLVYPERKVRLQFEGWPVVQFSGWPSTAVGTFAGIVKVVAPAVSANGRLRILIVEPEDEPWPDSRYLRFGARVNGWIQLDTVSLGYELWRQMNGFPPENTNPPPKETIPTTNKSAIE
jgi:multidrug efflux pump subunit AcrA (membrane-fusion protein)